MLLMAPLMVLGGVMISSVGSTINRDISDVWLGSMTRSQALLDRQAGQAPLLVVRDLNVSYGTVQVLFDVNLQIAEGEVVALLGTNGAGKSTLLKAISGITEADYGAVIFDGRDITHAPPHEIATFGVGQMPGGHGTFPTLTVADNLRVAGWQRRHDRAVHDQRVEALRATFPVLDDRWDEPAANLSGGQQQQLALAMNLAIAPRLLMIDELSLGLAPVVVERLVEVVREVAATGTAVIVVEQSVNVALTMAERAVFMEKGQVQFEGPTAELLERPDLLRSVFLGRVADVESTRSVNRDAATPTIAIEGRELSVTFGGIRAVDGVDLRVESGEIVGMIGPNGAGKTTLFDLLTGLTRADRGQVLVGDRDVTSWSPAERARIGLGRSFQDAALFGSMTVHEALAVSLDRWTAVRDPANAVLRMPAAIESEAAVRRRVDELIELFGLGRLRHVYVNQLSTGSRRVVDLAAAVGMSPDVLLLDEPSSGIAQRETEALAPLILRLRDELGCAIVVIEHDMPLLSAVSDRLIALEAGAVIASGSPRDVLANDRVVAGYLGTTAEIIARSGDR